MAMRRINLDDDYQPPKELRTLNNLDRDLHHLEHAGPTNTPRDGSRTQPRSTTPDTTRDGLGHGAHTIRDTLRTDIRNATSKAQARLRRLIDKIDGQPVYEPNPRWRCPSCGRYQRHKAKYCDHCGTPRSDEG